MRYSLCLIVLVAITNVYGNIALLKVPTPMPGLVISKIMGQWYAAFRKPPNSWSSSKGVVNLAPYMQYKDNNTIALNITWGNDVCHEMYCEEQILSPPGVVLMKDNSGDKLSGKAVIVSTDYKSYLVKWGCTKFSTLGEKCVDPYVVVFTRTTKHTAVTIATVNTVLQSTWGLTIQDLDTVQHIGQGGKFTSREILFGAPRSLATNNLGHISKGAILKLPVLK